MPIIPVTWEAVIEQIKVEDQPWQKVSRTLSQPIKKLAVEACTCHPSYVGGITRRIDVQAGAVKNKRPYWKNKAKRTRGIAQVIELLPSKCKA
jgi:hypothetical protein